MDNAFRFGNVEVVCEGYDYPDDPYILKGSCGLEYTIDYTMEGESRTSSVYVLKYEMSYTYPSTSRLAVNHRSLLKIKSRN